MCSLTRSSHMFDASTSELMNETRLFLLFLKLVIFVEFVRLGQVCLLVGTWVVLLSDTTSSDCRIRASLVSIGRFFAYISIFGRLQKCAASWITIECTVEFYVLCLNQTIERFAPLNRIGPWSRNYCNQCNKTHQRHFVWVGKCAWPNIRHSP